MSKRTSKASRAIASEWANEKIRILEGKGTRNWTPEQQRDILSKGRAYDEDGKAIEGHHMKSAEAFPEYQGDTGNIQFLTRTEHRSAHSGYFQNPTNGYYDPITGETSDFDIESYVPCQVIELSDPVVKVDDLQYNHNCIEIEKEFGTDITKTLEVDSQSANISNKNSTNNKQNIECPRPINTASNTVNPKRKKVSPLLEIVAHKLGYKSKTLMLYDLGIKAINILPTVVSIAANHAISNKSTKKYRLKSSVVKAMKNKARSSTNIKTSKHATPIIPTPSTPTARPSPQGHTVKSHGQHYNVDGKREWKVKDSYSRGRKLNDECNKWDLTGSIHIIKLKKHV